MKSSKILKKTNMKQTRDIPKRLAKDKASALISNYYFGRNQVFETIDENDAATKNSSDKGDHNNNKKTKKKADKRFLANKQKFGIETIAIDDSIVSNGEYNFSMLQTDDSTDEENSCDDVNRPLPPSWSFTDNRRLSIIKQKTVPLKIIDKFFGCGAEDVDLLEIFPKISQKELKRRKSSAFWQTPPRYSNLPKY